MLKKIQSHHRFMWGYTRALARSFLRPATLFLSFFALTAMGISSLIFYFLEHEANEKVPTYFEALYFTVTTMTSVGYGDVHPVTTSGKILSMLMMMGGTVIFVSFTAVIAASMMELEKEQ